ncbi:MAG: elongation factor P [Gammaproteobacteria bacterium]|nr:elongation factor P [Gammaproteobacteria bacterium]|tara:strand:+ start:909 stop:1478 length:570 start_codon:yes stop_codon:yes gene_type:complete
MASYNTSNIKNGLKVLINDDPFEIIDNSFHKPGKGQAFSKVKLKNLSNGRVVEKTLKIGDSLDSADVQTLDMQYLYKDDVNYYFMDMESFDQVSINKDILGDNDAWLKGEELCSVTFFNGNPIGIELPIFVELVVKHTEPGLKGDTTSKATKPATLETDAIIQVPLFINQNDIIKIDTRTKEYTARVKT